MTFVGASDHPLLRDWATWLSTQEHTWASEWRTLAGRGLALTCNDSFIAALVEAHVQGTLGPLGLRMSSLYDDASDMASTSDDAHGVRRQINAITGATWYGFDLDADGIRTRRALEASLAWSAFVLGDGFAVRVWKGGRNRWRLVDPQRVKNPDGRPNDDRTRDGFRLNADGAVDGIYVSTGKIGPYGTITDERARLIPWYADDGTPNVIHRVGKRLPGMVRGVTRLAPMIVMARQLSGVLESHVAKKRLQAILGMVVEADSPEEYKAAVEGGDAVAANLQVKGPLSVWVKPNGSTVEFTKSDFDGADLKDYLTICYRVQAAAVQMPVDVVLCQMGEASLASARAGLDQFDRSCQTEQEAHIAECTSQIDRAEIAAARASGMLAIPGGVAWPSVMAAKWQRPPKYSTDRKKDAETVKALMDASVSGTTAFEMIGLSWEDEQEQRRAEAEFLAAQGAGQSANPAAGEAAAPIDEPSSDGQEPAAGAMATARPVVSASWWRRIFKNRTRAA